MNKVASPLFLTARTKEEEQEEMVNEAEKGNKEGKEDKKSNMEGNEENKTKIRL